MPSPPSLPLRGRSVGAHGAARRARSAATLAWGWNRVSTDMANLLRHSARKRGLRVNDFGWVEVHQMLALDEFAGVTPDDVRWLVDNCPKQRFELWEARGQHAAAIRASQGHSMEHLSDEMHSRIIGVEMLGQPTVVHGTSVEAWLAIREEGLKTMGRNHIHFGLGLPRTGLDVSGMRAWAEVAIHIHVEQLLRAGVELLRSSNGVILTKGVRNQGVLPPSLFGRVVWIGPPEVTLFANGSDFTDHVRNSSVSFARAEKWWKEHSEWRQQYDWTASVLPAAAAVHFTTLPGSALSRHRGRSEGAGSFRRSMTPTPLPCQPSCAGDVPETSSVLEWRARAESWAWRNASDWRQTATSSADAAWAHERWSADDTWNAASPWHLAQGWRGSDRWAASSSEAHAETKAQVAKVIRQVVEDDTDSLHSGNNSVGERTPDGVSLTPFNDKQSSTWQISCHSKSLPSPARQARSVVMPIITEFDARMRACSRGADRIPSTTSHIGAALQAAPEQSTCPDPALPSVPSAVPGQRSRSSERSRRVAHQAFEPDTEVELALLVGDTIEITHDPQQRVRCKDRWVYGLNERTQLRGWLSRSCTTAIEAAAQAPGGAVATRAESEAAVVSLDQPEVRIARCAFEPEAEGELELLVDDLVEISHHPEATHSGASRWVYGLNKRTQLRGWFPEHFTMAAQAALARVAPP